ncbi:MFS transporter, DHA2 family, multidrug resistance protein [Polynucleobacter meluiroseus]|uniref:MFS transporter, DHA2 family, multidrug resistance protein n=1 Tax=Polynucleobacter meluiroseus TaxID=1938814 RepID=A0A240DZK8_9BURK|nr:DHA2 family efflux MFS transporter permease subunit [Polynucleobacter meluiroseus]SNX28060.1 MFS transporter, DHA2 family, multidrug resistance protein [Polynucleobacter meluiroseus]
MATTQNPPQLVGLKLVLATVALGLGSFMNILDISIANVSLPAIAGDFAVSPAQGTWVITSYAVSEAIMLPLTGWLAGRFGDVRQFIVATLLFTLASLLCGASQSFEMLLFSRVLQGVVGASMIPLSQSLIIKIFPANKRGAALGIWSLTLIVAPVLGPVVGGWLTDNYVWRLVFFINIPFGLLCAYAVTKTMKGRESPKVIKPIDKLGLGLLTVGIGSLQILLDKGNELNWFESSTIVTLAVVSAICLISLVIWELGEEHPIVDLRLFADRNFLIAATCLAVGSYAFYIFVIIGPLWMQTQLGYTPTLAGEVMAITGLLSIFFGPFFGINLDRIGARQVATIGFTAFGISAWMSGSITSNASFEHLQLVRLLAGIGIAGFFVPMTAISLSQMKPQQISSATGLTNFLRNMGGSVGTAVGVTIWQNNAANKHAQLTEYVNASNLAYDHFMTTLTSRGLSVLESKQYIDLLVNAQAYVLSTNHLLMMSGVIMASLIPIVWFAKPPFGGGGGGH